MGDTAPVLELRDQGGRVVALDGPPRRVVSLVPAATVTLLELGAGELLVGRTEYDEPPEVAALPSVGQGLNPSIERLVSLSPELVVRFEGQQDQATPQALDRAGIPHLGVRPDGIDDILAMIRLLGRAVDRDGPAEVLTNRIQGELARVAARVEDRARPRVAFLLGGDPPWAVTEGSFLHELLEIGGGDNALADAGVLYAPVSVEAVVDREVELILTLESATLPAALARFPVVRVPDRVQSPGPELAASAREIARALHPELAW